MLKNARLSLFFSFIQTVILLTSGVYLLSLPAYYVFVAIPLNMVDLLLPYEAVLCCVLSFIVLGEGILKVLEVIQK